MVSSLELYTKSVSAYFLIIIILGGGGKLALPAELYIYVDKCNYLQ